MLNDVKHRKGKIFIISGPSGSGKTTLYKKLLAEDKDLVKSVSVTTRVKRPGEKHGRDYIFMTPKMFQYKVRAGHFVEHEKVFGNYYGTPKKSIRDLQRTGKDVLLCIDVKGARAVCRKFPKAVTIFVKAHSLDELKRRLEQRGSEGQKIIQERLNRAKSELAQAKHYQYTIINNDRHKSFMKLKKIIQKEAGQ